MIQPEQLVGGEWAEWYRLTPVQRWLESEKLWQTYLALGGSLDPEPDTQSPFFNARAPRPRPAHGRTGVRVLRRGRVYPLRKGKIPTADELEREMENPNQLRIHALGWEQVTQPIPISDNFVFSLPEWSQRVSTVEEQMIALGSSPEEAAERVKEMSEEFPEAVQKIRDGIQKRSATKQVGRNDPCPCGSGKKYKRCCLNG